MRSSKSSGRISKESRCNKTKSKQIPRGLLPIRAQAGDLARVWVLSQTEEGSVAYNFPVGGGT